MNYCTEVHINGGEPPYFPPIDVWRGHRSYSMNTGQRCHATELLRETAPDRTSCQENSIYFLGHNTMHFLALCPKHWLQLRDILSGELRYADTDDHWLIREVIDALGHRLHEQAREEYAAQDLADQRARLLKRDASVLAANLIQGSVVYFIQAGKRGPIKIGVATNVRKRLDALQTGSPYRLRLRATVPGDLYTEGAYHRMFSEHRMSGEWFKPVAPILQEIKSIRAIAKKGETDGALF